MNTRKGKRDVRRVGLVCALMATVFAPGVRSSVAITAPVAKADLSAELRTIDSFGDDLFKLDKRSGELTKKATVSRAEFDSLQTSADALKRRLSDLQNAARAIITKLKASGEFDDLDSKVGAAISEASIRTRFNQSSLKRELEWAAGGLTNDADQITGPLENLRRKVSQRDSDLHSGSTVTVAYYAEPVVFTTGLKCSLAHMRFGLSKLVWGAVRAGADEAYNCACNIPSGYSCYTPTT
jgi:hypothetical protein